jgi:hypothetical protein
MSEIALSDALRIMAHVASDEPRAGPGPSWLMGAARLGRSLRPASLGWPAARRTPALWVLPVWLIVGLTLGAGATHAAAPPPSQPTEVWPVEAACREAFQLWADERFDALWERGLLASRYRVSREAFVRGMRHRVIQPACCWGQLRAVRVHHATDEALVEAQVGVDVKTLGTTVVRSMSVYLRREEGVWRVTLEDFLNKPEDALSGLRGPW